MGSRLTVVALAVLALALPSACAGRSIREIDGDSGAGGQPEPAGNGGKGGGSTEVGGGDNSASGGTAPRGGTDSPPAGAKGGTGATSGTSGSGASGNAPGSGGSGNAPGSGGSGNAAGAGGATCSPSGEIPLVPDSTGWMGRSGPCNSAGVQGGWYAFGDQYGNATCLDPGMHDPSECALITTPDPSSNVFPNVTGAMHTVGAVEQLLPCPPGLTSSGCPDHDYANMWGAGIGFDLNADPAELGGSRHTWDPGAYGVLGVRFTIDNVPLSGLRVEFPMLLTDEEAAAAEPALPPGSTTDDHPYGAPYWGAQRNGDGKYPPSPVTAGTNVIYLSDVASPKLSAYSFDQSRLLGIRFHVIAYGSTSISYDFTISDVTLTTQGRLDKRR